MRPSGFDGAQPGEPAPDWLPELGVERPLVYVTFGTEVANLAPIATVVEGLDGLSVDVVVTVGRDLDPEAFRPWPSNVRIERWVAQRFVLERAALLVSHAGSGAMLGAASVGIPQLCLPIAADQFENADVVAAACSGLAIEARTADAASIRDAVERLLQEQTFRQRAREIADEIAGMPTPEAVIAGDDLFQALAGF